MRASSRRPQGRKSWWRATCAVVLGGCVADVPPKDEPWASTGLAATGTATLVGAGDIAVCDWPKDQATGKLLESLPGTVFIAGDASNQSGTDYATCFQRAWGQHKSRIRPAPGNHDWVSSGASYFKYFGASAGPIGKGYYSYDLGNWHVVVLNSNCGSIGCGAGSTQEKWLRADLAAKGKKCTLAYWHHPRFSSGKHGNQSSVKALWQALQDYGAELVISGHDHTYQRWVPQRADGVADEAKGIVQFVVGTGGAPLYPFTTSRPPNTVVRRADTWGVLRLDLAASSYSWKFVPIAGQSFTDSGSRPCH